MSTYCEGSNCSKRDNCKLHNPGEGTHEYIDWSTYGSANFIKDNNGNYQAVIEHSCGDDGNFEHFQPMTALTKEDALINDINELFREALSKVLKPADLQIFDLLVKQQGTLLNELWGSIIETIYKHKIE